MEVGGGWWRLVEVGGGWWRLVEVGGGWWRLVEVGGGWWRLVEVGEKIGKDYVVAKDDAVREDGVTKNAAKSCSIDTSTSSKGQALKSGW